MRCGAKKRNGQPCQQWPIKGRTRCRLHGGKSRMGPGAGRFIHGRYSTFLPSRLAAHYEAAAHDPELLELRCDIALTDARIIDLLQRVDSGESGQLWRHAQATMRRFTREQAQGNLDAMPRALAQVQRLITDGAADYAAWQEVDEHLEQRRRLVDSETRRLAASHDILTSEQAMTLLSQVVAAIQRHVPDKAVLSAIAQDIQALAHHRHGHSCDDDISASSFCVPEGP
jgi:hypothetical protein